MKRINKTAINLLMRYCFLFICILFFRMGRYKMIEGPPGASTSWYYPGLHYHKHWIHRKVQQDTYFNQTLLFDLDS